MDKIRVFCVDDDEATTTLHRLVLATENDIEFVGASHSTVDLLRTIEVQKPSVLLLDFLMPGCDTLETLDDLGAAFPDLAVLILSGLDDTDVVTEVLRRGASGFIAKATHGANLASAVRRAAAGARTNAPRPSPFDSEGPKS